MNNNLIQILSAVAGSVGFALLFNVRGPRVVFTAVSGLVSWGAYIIFSRYLELDDFISYILASALLTLFSEIMARLQKAPAAIFLVIGMIPLLPGGSLYRTLHYAVALNWASFAKTGVYTIMLSMAIALGIITMMSVIKTLMVSKTAIRHFVQDIRK
ncbi:MAG: threonine/serine exporter family protein [Clostridiales bacterium]|nr:threonine/serine exporter family protein [Clostridiales bacterium]